MVPFYLGVSTSARRSRAKWMCIDVRGAGGAGGGGRDQASPCSLRAGGTRNRITLIVFCVSMRCAKTPRRAFIQFSQRPAATIFFKLRNVGRPGSVNTRSGVRYWSRVGLALRAQLALLVDRQVEPEYRYLEYCFRYFPPLDSVMRLHFVC